MQRKVIAVLLYIFGIAILFSTTAFAATTGTVAATVTVQNISVSVSDGTVAYGTLSVNSSAGTNASDTQTATNDGNVPVDFNIKGQNSANWTLGATAGADTYVHKFCTTGCTTPPTSYTSLTTNYQTLGTNIAAAGNQTFDLYVTTPTSSSNFTQQSVDVTVQAVIH